MDIVYIETTVIGHIAGRLHANPDIAAHQRITREWWSTAHSRYRLVSSRLTIDECGDGDPDAAAERLEVLRGIPLLAESHDAELLAKELVAQLAVPASEPRDALHIALAAANGVLHSGTTEGDRR